MHQPELLDALDRRARSAVEELDAAVGDPAPAEVPTREQAHRRWPRRLLLGAAVVAVVLVGALALFDGPGVIEEPLPDDPTEVTGDDGAPTGLTLPAPGELDFELYAVRQGTGPSDDGGIGEAPLSAQGPAEADDPWSAAVAVFTTDFENQFALRGEVVDLGGPDAVIRGLGVSTTVSWRDGDQVHHVSSTRVERDALLEIARSAVAAGFDGTGPLPGHVELYEGPTRDFYLSVDHPALNQVHTVLAYRHSGDLDFVIAWRIGSEDEFRASLLQSRVIDRVSVRGQDAVITSLGGSAALRTVSWREPDGTILHIGTHGDIRELLDLVEDRLTPIDADRFATLAEMTPAADDGRLLEPPEDGDLPLHTGGSFPDPSDENVLAAAGAPGDEVDYRAVVVRTPRGGARLQLRAEEPDGANGSGAPLRDLESTFLQQDVMRRGSADGAVTATEGAVVGVVPAGLEDVQIRGRTTGTVFDLSGLETVPIETSSRELLLVAFHGDEADSALEVVARTTDGGTFRYWL